MRAVLATLAIVVAMSVRAVVAPDSVTRPARPAVAAEGADDATTDARRSAATAPVTVAFGGDVHFESWLADAVRDHPDTALAPLRDLLGTADVAVVNLETAVTERGIAAAKRYAFRAPAQGVGALAAAGVDVVSIANNHGMDYGVEGLGDTLTAAAAHGIAVVGGGPSSAQAYRPYRVTVHGRRIAVFGATQVLDATTVDAWTAGPDRPGLASAKPEGGGLERLVAAVRDAARDTDTVIVMVHWGREGEHCPIPRQQQLATTLRGAGADVVVGGHAHRVGGGGFLGDTVVHYGLGNLVFYAEGGPGTQSGALTVTIAPDDRTTMQWRPAELRRGVATALRGPAAAQSHGAWRDLRGCAGLTAAPS